VSVSQPPSVTSTRSSSRRPAVALTDATGLQRDHVAGQQRVLASGRPQALMQLRARRRCRDREEAVARRSRPRFGRSRGTPHRSAAAQTAAPPISARLIGPPAAVRDPLTARWPALSSDLREPCHSTPPTPDGCPVERPGASRERAVLDVPDNTCRVDDLSCSFGVGGARCARWSASRTLRRRRGASKHESASCHDHAVAGPAMTAWLQSISDVGRAM
jgi:hypothetical protein